MCMENLTMQVVSELLRENSIPEEVVGTLESEFSIFVISLMGMHYLRYQTISKGFAILCPKVELE